MVQRSKEGRLGKRRSVGAGACDGARESERVCVSWGEVRARDVETGPSKESSLVKPSRRQSGVSVRRARMCATSFSRENSCDRKGWRRRWRRSWGWLRAGELCEGESASSAKRKLCGEIGTNGVLAVSRVADSAYKQTETQGSGDSEEC
jgi:hypothetical protein